MKKTFAALQKGKIAQPPHPPVTFEINIIQSDP